MTILIIRGLLLRAYDLLERNFISCCGIGLILAALVGTGVAPLLWSNPYADPGFWVIGGIFVGLGVPLTAIGARLPSS